MVLHSPGCGRVGRRRTSFRKSHPSRGGSFCFRAPICSSRVRGTRAPASRFVASRGGQRICARWLPWLTIAVARHVSARSRVHAVRVVMLARPDGALFSRRGGRRLIAQWPGTAGRTRESRSRRRAVTRQQVTCSSGRARRWCSTSGMPSRRLGVRRVRCPRAVGTPRTSSLHGRWPRDQCPGMALPVADDAVTGGLDGVDRIRVATRGCRAESQAPVSRPRRRRCPAGGRGSRRSTGVRSGVRGGPRSRRGCRRRSRRTPRRPS